MTFGSPASNTNITGAPYKHAIVQLMLNTSWSQTYNTKHVYVGRSCAGAHCSVIMAMKQTQTSCVVKRMYGKRDPFVQTV